VNHHLHVRIGKQTLEGLASKGGGPVFRRFGSRGGEYSSMKRIRNFMFLVQLHT
jgi:hypothetical protein